MRLPNRGDGFVRALPYDDTAYGMQIVVQALQEAAVSVARSHPHGAALRIGDLSAPGGGLHPRHKSHRSGRDVDVMLYLTQMDGRSAPGDGRRRIDRFGVARLGRRSQSRRDAATTTSDLQRFDVVRNWHFVRTLLLNDRALVQWIFCSQGIKSLLLRHAVTHETSADAIFRATWVLHQPSHGNPHSDHFHIRVGCTAADRSLGCQDAGPIWPWMRDTTDKAMTAGDRLDDAVIVQLLRPLE